MGRKSILWTQDEISKLGTISDSAIAKQKGVSIGTVAKKRNALGIASTKDTGTGHYLSKDEIALLGTDTDIRVAEKLGISHSSVVFARHSRGIKRQGRFEIDYPRWENISNIDQSDFYKKMAEYYRQKTNAKLTYPSLAKVCFWSVSRLQKWFTPGSAQETLAEPTRHHIWLAIITKANSYVQWS